ncbi:MAG: pilus assembly protein PilM [Candidatus Firestonebacteria bacterium]|nr:pilus assembly protein PilM [Candidatus Firestonebacteria bacterium]
MLLNLKKSYGLEIASSSIKIVELLRDGKLNRLISSEYSRNSTDGNISQESIVSALKKILNDNALTNEKFVISIPRNHCIIRKLNSPFKDINKIKSTINYEIEPHIPYSTSEINYDFFISKITDTGSEITVIAVNKAIIESYLKITEACGIKVDSITTSEISEYNFVSSKIKESDGLNVLINFGAKNTSITLIKDGQWEFSRSIQKGGDFLTEYIATQQKTSFADAEKNKTNIALNKNTEEILQKGLIEIFNEIRYTLTSYLSESNLKKIDKIFITGGGSQIDGISAKLSNYLEVKSEILSIDGFENNIPFAALGCAMEQKKTEGIISINLLPKPEYSSSQYKIQLIISAILLIFIFTAIGVNINLKVKAEEKKISLLNDEINKIFKETLPDIKNVVDAKQQLANAIKEENKKLSFYPDLLSNKLSPMETLRELNNVLDKVISVELAELGIVENSVILSGKTISFREIDRIKDKLKNSAYFKNVTVDSLKTKNDGKIEFKIIIKL